jgi:hypothetical protein
MSWAKMLAYLTGSVDRELLLRDDFLAARRGADQATSV